MEFVADTDIASLWSRPARGARIEISSSMCSNVGKRSRPARGAWIEISRRSCCWNGLPSRPSRGAWIQMRMASATVVRSPLVGDDFVLVGFKETEWTEQQKTQ